VIRARAAGGYNAEPAETRGRQNVRAARVQDKAGGSAEERAEMAIQQAGSARYGGGSSGNQDRQEQQAVGRVAEGAVSDRQIQKKGSSASARPSGAECVLCGKTESAMRIRQTHPVHAALNAIKTVRNDGNL